MTNYIKFHFKTDHQGSSIPYVYGCLPELGNGNAARGIELKPCNSIYNYIAEIRVRQPRNSDDNNWYSYCYKPRFGSIVYETGPKRYLPKISSSSGSVIDIYDTSDSVLAVCELAVRFRVKCHTNYGEELFIVGDCKELGNWQTKCAPQLFYDRDSDSWIGDICFPLTSSSRTIQYKYFVSNSEQEIRWEPEENHIIHLDSVSSPAFVEVSDTFRWFDQNLNTFTRSAFTEVITKRKNPVAPPRISPNSVKPGQVSINFSVMCPYVKRNQKLAIVGSCPELGGWDPKNSLNLADAHFPLWTGAITVQRSSLPFEYKYIICEQDNEPITQPIEINDDEDKENEMRYIWEECDNRNCHGITGDFVDTTFPATIILSDWYVSPNKTLFKGMGIHCPLFSLRTIESCGVGQFSDIRRLVDLCKLIGSSLIELLPLNDTNGSPNLFDVRDSSPYNIISSFALNPIYINLLEILPNLPSDIYNDIIGRKSQYEHRREIDYRDVYQFKINILQKIFDLVKDRLNSNRDFQEFCACNEEWLMPYCLFCVLRNEQGTSEFWNWKLDKNVRHITTEEISRLSSERIEDIQFVRWVQYTADRQLRASSEYASSSGVVLKVDVPFGVQKNSCDCWSNQRLFNLNFDEGSQPNEETPEGKDFGYVAYNWKAMKNDNFSWWRLRMKRLSDLFQSVHFDHAENFFRSWQVHRDETASTFDKIMGHFEPSVGITKEELENRGLWDIQRYTRPYVRMHILNDKFGRYAQTVANDYFVAKGIDSHDDYYEFKESCNTPAKLETILSRIPDESKRNHYRTCLLQLLSNVILIPVQNQENVYYFRSNVTVEHVENNNVVFPSTSFKELDFNQQQQILGLYNEFSFGRQTELWLNEGIPKLEMLDKSSNLLISADFGADYGDLFERETEAKSIIQLHSGLHENSRKSYDSVSSFNYLSQCQPTLPTSTTIRSWWEENKDASLSFWRDEMRQDQNQFHQYCLCNILTQILQYNLRSKSMWCVFLLQDVVNTFDCLRREYPNEERIFKNYQNKNGNLYRFPWSLEELITFREWTSYVRDLVQKANRQ